MKFLMFVLFSTLLFSCEKSEKLIEDSKSQSEFVRDEETPFILPRVGFTKAVPLNYNLEFMYENITFNPNGNGDILGDRPFYLEIDENNSVGIRFYSKTYLKNVKVINLGKYFETAKIKELKVSNLQGLQVKEITDFGREFTYGKAYSDYPEQDMLNKVFLIETQESDYPYLASSSLFIWVECHGGFQSKADKTYKCGHGNLVFNYKLADYKLQKNL